MTNEEQKARDLVRRIYELHQHQVRISPTWIATECMVSLDPERRSHPIEYAMAHLQFRQFARAICARQWEADDEFDPAEQHDLFPGLQKRYPAARKKGDEPEYILLEHLEDKDVVYNVRRLRREAKAKELHADRLEKWGEDRRRAA